MKVATFSSSRALEESPSSTKHGPAAFHDKKRRDEPARLFS